MQKHEYIQVLYPEKSLENKNKNYFQDYMTLLLLSFPRNNPSWNKSVASLP
jgi:hypothetical protein